MAAEVDFQAAIYARLADQILPSGPALGVYDIAPEGSAFPYVTLGVMDFRLDPVDGAQNFDVVARIHTWSRSTSVLQTKVIQGHIYAALHDHILQMPRFGGAGEVDWLCYSLLRESSQVLLEPDQAFHGVCEYRALIQSA